MVIGGGVFVGAKRRNLHDARDAVQRTRAEQRAGQLDVNAREALMARWAENAHRIDDGIAAGD